MTTLQVLKDARALISDPARWTCGVQARDAQGGVVSPVNPTAVCWCMDGALGRIAGVRNPLIAACRLALQGRESFIALAMFNDTHTHAEVLALFDTAITHLESEAAT